MDFIKFRKFHSKGKLTISVLTNNFNILYSFYQTEMEVSYFPEGGSITDYVCELFGTKVGVSVTRAMKYRGEYTEEDAATLLMKKLKGIGNIHTLMSYINAGNWWLIRLTVLIVSWQKLLPTRCKTIAYFDFTWVDVNTKFTVVIL